MLILVLEFTYLHIFMKKSWIVSWVLLISSLGWGYYYYSKNTASTTNRDLTMNQLTMVETWSIRTVVKATGKIYPVQESTLSFAKQWTITKVYKKVWDSVKKDDIIAEIDATSAYMDIKNAEISLSNAQNNYSELVNGGLEAEKLKSANTLSDSEAQLTLLEKQYTNLLTERDNAIKNAETSITSLQTSLELAKWELEYAEKNISTDTTANSLERDVSSAYTTIEQIYQLVPDYLKQLKDLSLIDDKANPKYGDLGAKDSGIKTSVESLYTTASTQKTEFESSFTTLKQNTTSVTQLLATLAKTKTILTTLNNLSTLIVAEYRASNESVYIPNTLITSTVSDMQTLSSTLSSRLSGVTSAIATLKGYGDDEIQELSDKNTLLAKKAAVKTAENNLTKAEQELSTTKTSYEAKILSAQQGITSAQNSIKINQINHSTTVWIGAKSELTSASNSVQSAKLSLEKAKLALKDYQIIANFDGVISDIPWVVGDTASTSEVVSIQNTNAYEIEVSLDQADVVKVKAWMPVNITLDAYADMTLTGSVSSVSSTPTESSSVISYTAKIFLSNVEKEIFSQMSATVEIIATERNNILMISSSATKSEKWKTYVEVLKGIWPDAISTKIEVELGVSDNGKVEVLSWLTLGQKLKIESSSTNTSSSSNSSSTKSSSSSQMGWGMMGGPPGF